MPLPRHAQSRFQHLQPQPGFLIGADLDLHRIRLVAGRPVIVRVVEMRLQRHPIRQVIGVLQKAFVVRRGEEKDDVAGQRPPVFTPHIHLEPEIRVIRLPIIDQEQRADLPVECLACRTGVVEQPRTLSGARRKGDGNGGMRAEVKAERLQAGGQPRGRKHFYCRQPGDGDAHRVAQQIPIRIEDFGHTRRLRLRQPAKGA